MGFTKHTPLHRPVVAEESEHIEVPDALRPTFEAIAKGVAAWHETMVREMTPYAQALTQIAEVWAKAQRRAQPREKPRATRKMQRLSSVRRRVLAYRREQVKR